MPDSFELIVQTVRQKAKGEQSYFITTVSDKRFFKYCNNLNC